MAGIARNVELYNLAFKLAWKYISEDQKRNQPNIARHLDDSIRRQLKEGTTEAVFIASEALKSRSPPSYRLNPAYAAFRLRHRITAGSYSRAA